MAYVFAVRTKEGEGHGTHSFAKASEAVAEIDRLRGDGWIVEHFADGSKPISEQHLRDLARSLSEQ